MTKKTLITIYVLLAFAIKPHAQCTTYINTFPFTEDFESSNGGWTPGGTSSDWAWGAPNKAVIRRPASGVNCWITGGLANPAYNNLENSYVTSPCFDFTTLVHPSLSVSVFWETEKQFDGANLQYSTDGGAVWLTLGVAGENPCNGTNWYNTAAINFLGGPGWCGNIQTVSGGCSIGGGSGDWVTATHDLTFLAGKKVIFRFHFAAGSTCNNFDGFAFDLFSITEKVTGPADFNSTCLGDQTVAFTSVTPTCPLTYAWNFADAASGANNTATDANPIHKFTAPGKYHVTLTITYAASPTSNVAHDVELIDGTIAVAKPILCNGNSNGSLTATGVGSSDPYGYVWNTSPAQNTPTISNLPAGHYVVTVTTANSCPVVKAYDLTEPDALDIKTPVTDALCGNSNGAINATITGGTPAYQYIWSNGNTTSSISNLPAGTYALAVKDANNCTAAAANIIVANKNQTVAVSLGPKQFVCPGHPIVLSPGNYAAYLWQDGSTAPTYTVTNGGVYTVQVTDANGCTGSSNVTITEDCGDIYFPVAFTPNDDTRNDEFGAYGNLPAVTNYVFKVFDRYGELVFTTNDPYKKWNGTRNGGKYNSGSFVWFATYTLLGRPNQVQQGTVVLVR